MEKTRTATKTYAGVVKAWAEERELLCYVQPYTARKAAQKALLLAPWMDTTSVAKIKPSAITAGLVGLGSNGGRFGAGLSSGTLRAVHLAGSQAVDWAIENNLAAANPFKQVARPKANYRQSKFLTMPQASGLAAEMAGKVRSMMIFGNVAHASFALAVCIALATGLRRGEVFALDWEAFDSTNKRLSVSKAIKADGAIGVPKSVSGVRSVAIGESLANLLSEVHVWQACVLPQKPWNSPRCIIADKHGDQASMNTFEHWWRAWVNDNGLDGLRFHELRHTHATLLISSGVDVKTVQMRLGHSSAEITMSCYAHAIPLSDGNAAAALDSALFN